jgi:hypothetical protein
MPPFYNLLLQNRMTAKLTAKGANNRGQWQTNWGFMKGRGGKNSSEHGRWRTLADSEQEVIRCLLISGLY